MFGVRFRAELLQVTTVWPGKVQRTCSETCVGSSEADEKIIGDTTDAYLIFFYGVKFISII